MALHMVSFEIFVKAMPPSLSELKVLPSFCFTFKISDDVAASSNYTSTIVTMATIKKDLKICTEFKVQIFMHKHKSPDHY